MWKARLVITAIEVEGRSPAEVVADYGVSRSWVYELRVNRCLHHIGVGRTLTGTAVLLLVQDLHIRVIGAVTGEPLRALVSTTGRPPGPAQPANDKRPNPRIVGSGVLDVLRHHSVGLTGFEPATP